MEARSVTVVIPALNAAGTIGRQMEALARQTEAPPFEVILVDNGCTDDTVMVAEAAASGRLTLRVVKESRRGINLARNAGISAAANEVILLCDADDEVSPAWVGALAGAVDSQHWAAGIVDYLAINDAATIERWMAPPLGVPEVDAPYIDRTFGCCCGFLRSMWEEVGGFDPRLSGPTDENEFFMRAYAAGYRPNVVPTALVAYRLRPGAKAWRRMRYKSGVGQGMAAGCAGGAHLLPLCKPLRSLWLMAKLVLAGPKYMLGARARHEWVGGVLRQWGRLVGWFSASGRAIRASER